MATSPVMKDVTCPEKADVLAEQSEIIEQPKLVEQCRFKIKNKLGGETLNIVFSENGKVCDLPMAKGDRY
ncbi:MAG: hypothetical protein KAS32_16325 [Candidatus Peribacteraceae bacterium]|nr:hypothetical protein [Candidatus Peribacteraceae bacterium]